MAFAKNIDVIINKMLQLQTPFYSVTEMDGKAILDENENKISVETASDNLTTFLHSIEGSVKVTLRMKSKKDRSEGGSAKDNHTFAIRLGETSSRGVAGVDQTILGLVQSNFNSQVQAIKQDYENREALRLLKEDLEEKNSTSLSDILEHIKPFIPAILNKIGMLPGAAPAIAGTESEVIPETKVDDTQIARLNVAVSTLLSIDPNFVETLEILAKFASQGPEQYKSFIPILKSQVK